MDNRPSWDEYFMELAFAASRRSTCTRRMVGAVIVVERSIVGTGYNGSPAGAKHCIDPGVGCLKVGNQPNCHRTVHAEQNAIAQAARNGIRTNGGTLYCTDYPCHPCAKLIVSAGIREVVFARPYLSDLTLNLFLEAEVVCRQTTGWGRFE